jgi:hypothetical protein
MRVLKFVSMFVNIMVAVMMTVFMVMFMRRIIVMMMFVRMGMTVLVVVMMVVTVRMAMVVFEMNIELRAFNLKPFGPFGVQVIPVEMELFEFVLELVKINTKIQHRADKHITANAAEDVEVEGFHERHILCSRFAMFSSCNLYVAFDTRNSSEITLSRAQSRPN